MTNSTNESQSAPHDPDWIQALGDHIEHHIGPVANVIQEMVSDVVRIDLFLIEPDESRDYFTLVTCGMSSRPMDVPITDPDDLVLAPRRRYAELVLALPPTWPIYSDLLREEDYFWPIRWLKRIARLPHLYSDWVATGVTIPNGNPPQPVAPSTELCSFLLHEPMLFPEEFRTLQREEQIINFYSLVPLYEDELNFKIANKTDKLTQLFTQHQVTELVQPNRPHLPVGTAP
ncbi:MAG: suppressor of fused domain protein [Zavarzinella sp.]